jgi:hypothetical protein
MFHKMLYCDNYSNTSAVNKVNLPHFHLSKISNSTITEILFRFTAGLNPYSSHRQDGGVDCTETGTELITKR